MNQRTGTVRAVVVAFVFLSTLPVSAQPTVTPGELEPGRYTHVDPSQAEPCGFTHNLDPDTLVSGVGIVCQGGGISTDNQFLRIFDLDVDHALSGPVCVEELEYGVEQAIGGPGLTFNVSCVPHGFGENLILDREVLDAGEVFTVSIEQPDAQLVFFDQPLGGCCNADTHDMAIEIATEDCLESGGCTLFIPGGNDNLDIRPYFLGAPDCSIDEPINADAITGLGVPPLVWNVTARCGEPVPALTIPGAILTLLLLGGLGSYLAASRRTARPS